MATHQTPPLAVTILALLVGPTLTACQSVDHDEANDTEMKAFDVPLAAPGDEAPPPEVAEGAATEVEPLSAVPPTGEPEATAPVAEPAQDEGRRYALGTLDDDDLRQVVYHGLEIRLAKGDGDGNDQAAATEIGDVDTFKFTIIKLVRGPDDISGITAEVPDGMDVQVTGWFKRTAADGDAKPSCTSFDATVAIVKRVSGDWTVASGKQPAFGREDSEDCY
jgi:hypothetical protein